MRFRNDIGAIARGFFRARAARAANDASWSQSRPARGVKSRLATVATLAGAYAAAHVAVAGVVHALSSPDAPAAMPPGAVFMLSAAEAASDHAPAIDDDCRN